eukprot:Phypoly_transcript_03245.p1 GENE.Phypoly_transcript_03245~~Phypoly_transcript_03245.p1  ORF type:complete len:803 (+),score=274.81 Phypoly_transcript_03245:77-2485(+)
MFVDRRGSREGKKTSLRQTDRAKKHVTTVQANAGQGLMRTCVPANLLPTTHAQPIFDAGCNLVNRQFENDFQRVVTRALKDGVAGMVMVTNDFDKVGSAITLCKWLPGVLYCAAGIHPNNISSKKLSDKQFQQMVGQLREKLVLPEVAALLCGVDFTRDVGLRVPQEKFLREELKMAGELDLPVVFVLSHASQTSEEEGDELSILLEIIKECREQFKEGLVHNFYGSESQLKQLIDLDLHVSISGIVTTEKHSSVVNIIPLIPRDKFLICSDSPYHTPQNIADSFIRESRNEPSNLPFVLQVCAKAYGITPKELSENVLENAKNFFNLSAESSEDSKKSESEKGETKEVKKGEKGEAKGGKKQGAGEKEKKGKKGEEEEEEEEEEEVAKKGGKKNTKSKKGGEEEGEEEIKGKSEKGGKKSTKGGKGKAKGKESDEEPVAKSKKGQQPPKKVTKDSEEEEEEEEEVEKAGKKSTKGNKGKGKGKESDEEPVVKAKKGQKPPKKITKDSEEEEEEEEEIPKPKRGKQKDSEDEAPKQKKAPKPKGGKKPEPKEEGPIVRPKKGKSKGKGYDYSSEEDVTVKEDFIKKAPPKEEESKKPKEEESKKAQKAAQNEPEKEKEGLNKKSSKKETNGIISEVKNLSIEDSESDESGEPGVVDYACKMCRTKLFTSENLQSHQTVQGLKEGMCRMYFLDKLDWMKEGAEGRLACPKCDQKLGRFDANGISCSCGEIVKPAYKVQKSRVDPVGEKPKNSDSSDQDLQFGDAKKKQKKKKGGPKKVSKGNFTHFRNKDYSGAKTRESESDE